MLNFSIVDVQSYLVHYDWDFYYDEIHNIHVELDKNHYLDQKILLNECFQNKATIKYDKIAREMIIFEKSLTK